VGILRKICIKNIVSNEEPTDQDATFSCVDCDQEFATRKELEEHETKHQNLKN
jgi:hypothetical protein